MDASKDFAKSFAETSGKRPFLSFSDQQPHTVTLIKDKRDKIDDQNNPGEKVDGVRYVVDVSGMEMEFFTSSISLIQKLAVCEKGETVTIQQTKNKTDKGFRTGYKVTKGESELKTEHELANEEPEPEADPNW